MPASQQCRVASSHTRFSINGIAPLLLLCTGTLVVIASQVVSNQAAISPQAQVLTLVRYMFTCALSATLVTLEQRMQAPAPRTAKAKAAANTSAHSKPWVPLLYVGVLDVGCYGLYNLGFAWCGSAVATIVLAASGQITTAVLSVLILKRQLRARHLAAVGIVTVGLVLRSMDDLLAGSLLNSNSKAGGSSSGSSSRQTQGALLVVASALLFSILGIIYERRSEGGTQRMSQAQTSLTVSSVSLALTVLHQLVFVLPSWQQLVTQPLAASGHSMHSVVLAHTVYGVVTAVHQYVQLRVLCSHGAMTVGLVNAVRASVVSVVSSLLFCHANKPQLCLTHWRAVSAVVVTLGATQWVFAGKPLTKQQMAKKDS